MARNDVVPELVADLGRWLRQLPPAGRMTASDAIQAADLALAEVGAEFRALRRRPTVAAADAARALERLSDYLAVKYEAHSEALVPQGVRNALVEQGAKLFRALDPPAVGEDPGPLASPRAGSDWVVAVGLAIALPWILRKLRERD